MGANEKKGKPGASRPRKKEKKNLAVILAVVLIGLFAFKGFLMFRGNDTVKLKDKSPVSNLVVTNAKAGLTIMGMALKDYQKAKGTFPAGLKDLYPDYVKDKASVDYPGWQYSTEGKDYFRLERVEERDGVKYLYRIDTGYEVAKTAMGGNSKEAVLAKKHGLKLPSASKGAHPSASGMDAKVNTEGVDIAATAQDLQEARLKEQRMEAEKSMPSEQGLEEKTKEENFEPVAPPRRWAALKPENSIPEDISALTHALSTSSSFLIWMNKQKALCFSNVQYSRIEDIEAICARENWLIPDAASFGTKAN